MSLFEQASLVVTPNAYKSGKLYSIKPTDGSGDLDVVRATSATRVNANRVIEVVGNNVVRLDYTNASCPSILVEPQRTNLLLRSEEFDNASWVLLNSTLVTTNQAISPDGNLTADLITGVNSASSISQTYAGSIGVVYTASFFIKNNNSTQSRLLIRNASTVVESNLNWTGSVLTSITNTIGITTFKSYDNGWYRIMSTYTSIEAAQRPRIIPTLSTNQSVFLWGAQLEAGANATSYIPTVASTVTRNADVISKTGISSLIGQTEGTIFVEFDIPSNTENGDIIAVRVGTSSANGFFVSYRSSSVIQLIVRISSTNALIFQRLGAYPIGKNKLAVAYKNGDFAISLNGTATQVNTSTITMPTSLDSVALFSGNMYTQTLPIQYAQALLFKTRLSNDELATLTTL